MSSLESPISGTHATNGARFGCERQRLAEDRQGLTWNGLQLNCKYVTNTSELQQHASSGCVHVRICYSYTYLCI